jgi:transposase
MTISSDIEPAPTKTDLPKKKAPLPTLWEVPDALWEKIFQPLIDQYDPPKVRGRKRVDARKCLEGIIYRARTGCQWNQLPEKFGNDTTVFRTLRRWDEAGIFDKGWALLIYHCEDFNAVHWEWQSADGSLNKARFIGDGSKGGIKRASQKNGVKKKFLSKTPQKASSTPRKVSAPTPRIAQNWVSSRASLLREEATPLLSALRVRM